MSDTPRTDAVSFLAVTSKEPLAMMRELVEADFARTLERENDELKNESARLRSAGMYQSGVADANQSGILRLERGLALLTADLAECKKFRNLYLAELQKEHARYEALCAAVMGHPGVPTDVVRLATEQRELAEMFREAPST